MFVQARAADRPQRVRKFYRIISVGAGLLLLLAGLDSLGLFGESTQREPFYTIVVVLTFGTAFAGIGLAIVALLGSFMLAGNWRLALPAWLYAAAAALVFVDQMLMEGEAGLWTPATVFVGASLIAAAWAGWFPDGAGS